MWTRKELKNKAKQSLKGNYWRVVLISLIMFFLTGGSVVTIQDKKDLELFNTTEGETSVISDSELASMGITDLDTKEISTLIISVLVATTILYVIILVVTFAYKGLIYNPFDVGARRFFFKNLNEKANIKEIIYAFENQYTNVAKILFVRDLKVALWSMLFVVPGIIKSYEYYMLPYLLAENPNLTKKEAFALSKQMMKGNKWNTVVLELSFIGWNILSAMTFGLVGIFYLEPYRNLTVAALYEEISAANGYPASPEVPVIVEEVAEEIASVDETI